MNRPTVLFASLLLLALVECRAPNSQPNQAPTMPRNSLTVISPEKPKFEISNLTGSWEGVNRKGDNAVFQFYSGGTAQFTLNGKPLVPTAPNGPTLKYVVNSDKSPVWLDLIGIDENGKELGRMKFIIELIGSKEMRIQAEKGLIVRPEKFGPADSPHIIVLKKIIELPNH